MTEGRWIPHGTARPSLTDYYKSYLGISPTLHSLYKNKTKQQYNKNNNNGLHEHSCWRGKRQNGYPVSTCLFMGVSFAFPGVSWWWSVCVRVCARVCACVHVCVCVRMRTPVLGQVCMHRWGLGAPDQSVPGQTTSNGSSSMKTHLKPRTSKCSYSIQKEKKCINSKGKKTNQPQTTLKWQPLMSGHQPLYSVF